MVAPILKKSIADLQSVLAGLEQLAGPLQALGDAMVKCWAKNGKVLVAGNGGSAADAMHLAEELSVRYHKNRRGLAAVALCDPTVLTCAGNDFGYEAVFSRQVEALGNAGDVFIGLTTSGNSPNMVRAFEAAKRGGLMTVSMLGKDGGKLKGVCDIELLVPSPNTARVQEAHTVLFHTLCEWVDLKIT